MRHVTLFALTFLAAGQLAAQTPAATSAPAAEVEKLQAQLADWAGLKRYQADDAALAANLQAHRVVFLGDSITDFWGRSPGGAPFFPDEPWVNRGISGQTTPQMLIRFQQDVVHLQPEAVVILAGTNDIAGNTGPSTPEMIEDNWESMGDIATQSGIHVIFASILPAIAYPWRPGIHPAPEIIELNLWLRQFCVRKGFVYLDYYSAMADAEGTMKPGLSKDGVHPTEAGYAVMAPLARQAIARSLGH